MQFNWWQTILAGLIIFAAGFFIRQWTIDTVTTVPEPTTTVVSGHPDTSYHAQPPLTGGSAGFTEVKPIETTPDTQYVLPKTDFYYEKVVDDTVNNVYIRSRSYPYMENDSLQIFTSIEYKIEPRPVELVQRVDTVRIEIPTPVYIEKHVDLSFFEKPAVTYTIGIIIGTALTAGVAYLLRNKE